MQQGELCGTRRHDVIVADGRLAAATWGGLRPWRAVEEGRNEGHQRPQGGPGFLGEHEAVDAIGTSVCHFELLIDWSILKQRLESRRAEARSRQAELALKLLKYMRLNRRKLLQEPCILAHFLAPHPDFLATHPQSSETGEFCKAASALCGFWANPFDSVTWVAQYGDHPRECKTTSAQNHAKDRPICVQCYTQAFKCVYM